MSVFCLVLVSCALFCPNICARIQFDSHSSSMVIKPADSQLVLENVQTVTGFSEFSIIKSNGRVTPDSWAEQYYDSVVISQEGSELPATLLVNANSNAINYGLKNNSNVIAKIANFSLVYDTHQIYMANTTEENLVFYKNGFTVNAGSVLTLNTPIPATGNINLNGTGRISLANDFYLGSNAYLTSGGLLDGNGFALVLSCTFAIPENQTLQIGSDTIINGHGTTLYLEPHAQIAVDYGVTLTLKNVRIKNTRNAVSRPILAGSPNSKIVLQDVELALADDFYFNRGQLFIHDDVVVSGTSNFWYASEEQSYIADGATFGFDKGASFFYHPVTADNTLMHMCSKTASMFFDGASLKTTHTGLRLSTGTVYFDNNVNLDSTFGLSYEEDWDSWVGVDSRDQGGDSVVACEWSPDGKCLAVGTTAQPGQPPSGSPDGGVYYRHELRVYGFDGNALTGIASKDQGGDGAQSVSWHPGGTYIAIVTSNNPSTGEDGVTAFHEVRVYRFDGTSLTGVASIDQASIHVRSVDWSPDGNYIAIGANLNPVVGEPLSTTNIGSGHEVQVFQFDTTSTPTIFGVASKNQDKQVWAVRWDPSGNYLAVGTDAAPVPGEPGSNIIETGHELQIYQFDTSSTPTLFGVASKDQDQTVRLIDWRYDGKYLAVAAHANPVPGEPGDTIPTGHEVQVYEFDTSSTPTLFGVVSKEEGAVNVFSAAWSPDGNYLAIGTDTNPTVGDPVIGDDHELQIYQFDTTSTPTLIGTLSKNFNKDVFSIAWRPDHEYIAVGTQAAPLGDDLPAGHELRVYKKGYTYTVAPSIDATPQSISNCIIFGDSSVSDGNLDAYVLGGAHVHVDGMLVDDSV